jgi:ATPase subunit of ABC transporter with duplicated ATPase domains
METAFIILGFVVYFGFKIYKNFKAEMDKAKLRAEQQKKEQVKANSNIESLKQFDGREHIESKKEEAKQRRNVLDALKSKKVPLDYYNPEIPAEEVVANRLIHEPHHHEFKRLELVEKNEFQFDLRQAIIQQAILERPKY